MGPKIYFIRFKPGFIRSIDLAFFREIVANELDLELPHSTPDAPNPTTSMIMPESQNFSYLSKVLSLPLPHELDHD